MYKDRLSILSIDLEDWFHLIGVGPKPSEWPDLESRVDEPVDWLLELLDDTSRRATFYCLGWLANRRPDLIRKIAERGHEIGTHSYWHRPLSDLDPTEFQKDLRESIAAIEDAAQHPVTTYRAPGFSLTPAQDWAFEILLEEGITTDSSISPGFHFHGGFKEFPQAGPAIIQTQSGTLKEMPLSVIGMGRFKVCVTGGGFFRATPASVLHLVASRSDYVMLYFHPRDFDPDTPVLEGLSLSRRLRKRLGLKSAQGKFAQLLRSMPTSTISEATDAVDWLSVANLSIAPKPHIQEGSYRHS